MGDFNQYLWVKRNLELIKPTVLEIGSKFYSEETFIDYRKLCIENNIGYLGVDLIDGQNVDVAVDFTDDMSEIENKLHFSKFNTVICCSVLEHVKNIFQFAKNVSSMINTNGVLFISVPFIWEFHGYPDDYWRFTPAGIEYLFDQFIFPIEYRTVSSHLPNDIEKLTNNPNHFSYKTLLNGTNNPESLNTHINLLRSLYNLVIRKKVKDGRLLYNSIGTTRFFKSCCINMIGFKK
jgi:hypothetical protein